MRRTVPSFAACGLLALAALWCRPAPATTVPVEAVEDGWIEGRLGAMSLREKIGQMIMIDVPGPSFTPAMQAHLADGHYGGVLFFGENIRDEDQTKLYIRQLKNQTMVDTGVPLLVAVDQEGGRVSRLKPLVDQMATRLSARAVGELLAYKPKKTETLVGQLIADLARRMHSIGFNMNLAPVLDLTGDRKSYIYDRSFGNDPEFVARVTGQFADAMQANGVIATGKHFPNLSGTRVDSHKDLPILDRSLSALNAHEFVPFARLKSRLGAVMVGHVIVPQIDPKNPASISPAVIRTLRQSVGWQGVIITDDLKMGALAAHYPFPEILARAIDADVDILLLAVGMDKQKQAIDMIERAVSTGKISQARIDRSVRRILALKYKFSM